MQQNDDKERVIFWNFWHWQYLSRNNTYKKEYASYKKSIKQTTQEALRKLLGKDKIPPKDINTILEILEDKTTRQYKLTQFLKERPVVDLGRIPPDTWLLSIINEVEDDAIDYFLEEFDYHPISPASNTDSNAILNSIQSKSLNKDIFLPDQLDTCFEYSLLDDGRISYTICQGKKIEQILAEVKYLFNLNSPSTCQCCGELISTKGKTTADKTDEAYYEIAKIKMNMKNISFKLDDNPRGLGLWLWDYLTEKHGQDDLPHGALTESINQLKARFNLNELGYGGSKQRVFENQYHGTCRCIEACEVLPF